MYIQNINSVFCRPIASGENDGWSNASRSPFNGTYNSNNYGSGVNGDFRAVNDVVYYPDILTNDSGRCIRLAGDGYSSYNNGGLGNPGIGVWSQPSGQSWYVESPYFQGNSKSLNVSIFYAQTRSNLTELTNWISYYAKINGSWQVGSGIGFKDLYTSFPSGIIRGYQYNFPYVGPSGDFANLQVGIQIDKLVPGDNNNTSSFVPVGFLYDIYAEVVLDDGLPLYSYGDIPNTSGQIPLYTTTLNTKSSGINLFISGTPAPASGSISLYTSGITGQINSIPSYTYGDILTYSGVSGVPLYISGPFPSSGSIPLFLYDIYGELNTTLFTSGMYFNNTSLDLYTAGPYPATSGVSLFLYDIYGEVNSPLYMYGIFNNTSDIPLSISGVYSLDGQFNLYTRGPDPYSGNLGIPLYVTTSEDGLSNSTSIYNNISIWMSGGTGSGNRGISLYVGSPSTGSGLRGLNLYVHNPNSGICTLGVPLTIANQFSGVYNSVPMYTANLRDLSIFDPLYFELEDGAVPLEGYTTLFLSAGLAGDLPLYLYNSQGSGNLSVPLVLNSTFASVSGINLYTKSADGQSYPIVVYTHGY